MVTTTTTTAAVQRMLNNSTAFSAPTSTAAPSSSSFCLSCGFHFGHVVDGLDDTAAGILIVVSVLVLCCLLCFLIGYCWCNKRRHNNKVYQDVNGYTTDNTSQEESMGNGEET